MAVNHATAGAASRPVPSDRYALAAFVAGAGILHFTHTATFAAMVPTQLPWPELLVRVSGVIEIGLGLGLLSARTRVLAAWGLVALFIAVYPANISMALHPERPMVGVPIQPTPLLLWLRLPLQFVFIAWAVRHARAAR
jgi:uncharacterized membrane protein